MQFLVMAYDRTDEGALERRMKARPAHVELGDKRRSEGKHLYGVAILDDLGTMIGSAMVVEYPSRMELDLWLAEEPYVTEEVWQEIKITPCLVGPSFAAK